MVTETGKCRGASSLDGPPSSINWPSSARGRRLATSARRSNRQSKETGKTLDLNLLNMKIAAAAERNKAPILSVLKQALPNDGLVLEVASGSGQHVVHFAAALTGLIWQPSDCDESLLRSIAAHVSASGLENVAPPIMLDVRMEAWPVSRADAILCINMIHIAPWSAAEGVIRGAARLLKHGQPLIIYGPFSQGGCHTAPSNAEFDANLRRRNAEWGVRDLDDVTALAEGHGFTLEQVIAMPANNLTVVFRAGDRSQRVPA